MESKNRPGAVAAREETALNMFRQMDLKGSAKNDTQLHTVHQNTISTIRVYEESGGIVRKYSSKFKLLSVDRLCFMLTIMLEKASGVDGRVVIWSV